MNADIPTYSMVFGYGADGQNGTLNTHEAPMIRLATFKAHPIPRNKSFTAVGEIQVTLLRLLDQSLLAFFIREV